jgi:hypothetical protein
MKAILKLVFLGVILLANLTITSCQENEVSKTQLKLARYSVTAKDMPKGWRFAGDDWSNDYGGESYLVAYGESKLNGLSHTISFYVDEEAAKSAYPKWEDDWFVDTQKWTDADFVPSNPSDDYRYECTVAPVPDKTILSCRYLQRHKQFISFILVNFDKDVVAFHKLNDILKSIDNKLNQISLE